MGVHIILSHPCIFHNGGFLIESTLHAENGKEEPSSLKCDASVRMGFSYTLEETHHKQNTRRL